MQKDFIISNQSNVPKKRWFYVIFPLLVVCILSYMDRVNIAFALPGGMSEDLAINASMAGLASGIFFIGYLFLQVPAGRIASKGRAKRFIAYSLAAWAVISILTGFIQSVNHLLILRFLLGVAEGGMLPVILTMVSQWFPEHERGRAIAMVIMFVPIAGMISGPLAGLIISLSSWRELFIIEGILTFAFIFIWLKMAYDHPNEAKWISQAEKDYILHELQIEKEKYADKIAISSPKLSNIVKDKLLWVLILIFFMFQFGVYGYTLWLPTILKQLTHGGINQIGWLSVLPFLACIIGMFTVSYLSDKLNIRKWFVSLSLLGFGLSLFFSVYFNANTFISYLFIIGAGFFLQAASAPFWTILPKLCSVESAGSTRGVINSLGNLGGFCGPYVVGVLIDNYNNEIGIYSMVAVLVLAAFITALLPKRCG
jgi:MFS family permease